MEEIDSVLQQEQIPESHTDSFDALKVSDEVLADLKEKLYRRYRELQESRERSQWERDMARAFEAYHMMEKIKDLPYPGYPNLSSVLPRIGVDSFHANVMQSLFGNGFRNLVSPRYMNPQFVRSAKKGADFLSYQLEQECNFYQVMDDADRKAQIFGIGYIEPYYVKEHIWETTLVNVTTEVQKTDPVTKEVTIKPVTRQEKKKKRKTIFDGIKMESLPIYNIYISPFVRDMKTAIKGGDVIFKRFTLTWEQILFRTKPDIDTGIPFYKKENVDKLRLYVGTKYKDEWTQLERKRIEFDGFFLDRLMAPKHVDLAEAHLWYDIDNDGVQEKIIVTVHPETGEILRVSFGPCRIVELRPRPVDERFYGEGIPMICKNFDIEWEAIHNARVAMGQWANTPFGFYAAGGRFNPSEITIIPGHFYPVDRPNEVNFAQNPVVSPSFYKEEELLFNYFERVFGLSENLQGITSAREQTATENIQIANKAMVRFTNPFTRIVLTVEELLAHMWDLNRACGPEEKEYYITGVSSVPMFSKMSKNDYAANLDFKLNVSTVFDEQLMRDTWLLVYNLMMQNPLVQPHPGAIYDLTDNLLKAVNVKLNIPIPPEAKVNSPMEEHEMMLEGQDVEPQVGEDVEDHLQYHTKQLQCKDIENWSPECIKRLMVHIDKTKILQATLQKFQLNQSGQFQGMPSPIQPQGGQPGMTATRNPSQMFNNMRVGQTGNSQRNNAQIPPGQNPSYPQNPAGR